MNHLRHVKVQIGGENMQICICVRPTVSLKFQQENIVSNCWHQLGQKLDLTTIFFRRACHNIFRLEIIFDLLYWHRRKFLFRGSRYHRYFCRVQFCLKAGKKPTDRHVQRWTKNPPPSKLCSFAEMAVIISNQCRELGFVYYQLLKLYFRSRGEKKNVALKMMLRELFETRKLV